MSKAARKPQEPDLIALARDNWVEHGWGEAAEGMAAVTSVMRAQQILLARVDDVLRPFALTFARYELLMLLHFSSNGSLPASKAAQRLQVHPTSVTNSVDRLESAGLVRRVPHPTDGRAILIEITGSGRETALKATDALNRDVFAQPGVKRVSTLVDVLTDLRKQAGDF